MANILTPAGAIGAGTGRIAMKEEIVDIKIPMSHSELALEAMIAKLIEQGFQPIPQTYTATIIKEEFSCSMVCVKTQIKEKML